MSLTASLMAPKKKAVSNIHELDAQLASLDLASIDVVDSKSQEFANVLKYSQDTYNGIGVSLFVLLCWYSELALMNKKNRDVILRKAGKPRLISMRYSGSSARASRNVGPVEDGIKPTKGKGCCYGTDRVRPISRVSSSKVCASRPLKVCLFSFIFKLLLANKNFSSRYWLRVWQRGIFW
jgi:hypothetical protein